MLLYFSVFWRKKVSFLLKTLIIYASKTGTTKKCAALLAANLGAENCDICSVYDDLPEVSGYDCIIIGSYIRMGVLDKKIISFISGNSEALFKMPFGIFLCGCLEDKLQDAIIKNLSEELLNHALCVDYFGGELHQECYKGIEKLFAKSITKISGKDSNFKIETKIHPETISAFVNEIKDKI